MDDLEIVELFFARNEQAIRETAEKYGKLCFKIADNILNNFQDAEECVNDTYLGLWNKIPPTRPNSLSAFICKIVRNLSMKKLDYKLAQKRDSNAVISLSELEDILPDNRISSAFSDEQIGHLISEFLQKEKSDSRNVFVRKYWFFDTVSDIAVRYSFSEGKVKNMLYHTRNRLREYLKKEGVEI